MADIKSKLTLDNSQFERAAKISKSAISGLGKGLSAVGGAAKFAAASFVGAAGALGALVAVQTRAIDRLGKVAKVTGFAAETLQKFQFAAEQSGVTADNAALALRRFSRRLGEAQRGTGELLPALKKLGIEVYNNNGTLKSAEDVLFEFADGIANSKNESEQLSLAFKAFDSEGAELVETLKDGATGLRAFFDEADALGIVLSTSAIRGVEEFADEFNRLYNIITGLAAQFTAALAPALEAITNKLRDFLQVTIEEQGGMEAFANFLRDKLIGILNTVINQFITLYNVFVNVLNAIQKSLAAAGFIEDADAIRATIADLREESNKGFFERTQFKTLIGKYKELQEEFGKFEYFSGEDYDRAIAILEAKIRDLESRGVGLQLLKPITEEERSNILGFLTQFTTEGIAAAEEVSEAVASAMEEIVVIGVSRVGETLLGKLFGVARVTKFWNDWYTLGEDAMTRLGLIAKLVLGEELVNRIKDLVAASDLGDYTKTLAEGFVSAAKQFEDALADAFVKGKADFSQLADFIKQTLAKAFIQKTITGPLLALFGLASGGPAKKGQPYIIGEEGPEIFVPKTNGTVLPNSAFDSLAGGSNMGIGGVTNVYYRIEATDPASFQAQLARDPSFVYAVTRTGQRSVPGR